MLTPADYFDLSDPQTAALFAGCTYPWDALKSLPARLAELTGTGQTIRGQVAPGAWIGEADIWIEAGAIVEPGAFVVGPAYIGAGAVVRHGAYVRENVIMLAGSLLGHASEAKHSILLPGAHAPHFNYVGDSVLGARSNLGAGTKLSNLAMNSEKDPTTGKRSTIKLDYEGKVIDTGLAKFGAILGDDAQTGCNAVLNPGCVVGPRTLVYANLSLRKGIHPADSVIKLRQGTSVIPRR
jgi:bifunctional UDP-N-acetylglucosamine pyrophosphorylase/glucosamine-1-phosphate N-acetyltransferase